MEGLIQEITGIRVEALRGQDISAFAVNERLSWAIGRETKREEDRAYSLLGLFNSSMPPLYGEGVESAMARLIDVILKRMGGSFHGAQALSKPVESWGTDYSTAPVYPMHFQGVGIEPLDFQDVAVEGKSPADLLLHLTVKQITTDQNALVTVGQNDQVDFLSSFERHHRSLEFAKTAVMEWLDMADFSKQNNLRQQYEKQLSLHLDGTCDWILNIQKYVTWASDNFDCMASRVLWIHGPAGYGKTVLFAKVVEHFQMSHTTPSAFFFSTSQAVSATAHDINFIIRSWLTQLASTDPTILHLICRYLPRSSMDGKALDSKVWEIFTALLETKQGITLFLDGLDEYPQINNARIEFLQKLKTAACGTTTRILITSRATVDIKAELSPEKSQNSKQTLFSHKLTKDDVIGDLKLYSNSVVNRNLPRKDESLRTKLSGQLAERCEGMFLWITLQQPRLRDTKSKTALEKIIQNMPTGLTETYQRKWDEIKRQHPEDRSRAFDILRWTVFSLRPLSVAEVTEALIVSAFAGDRSLPIDELPDEVDEEFIDQEILAICGSLVEARTRKVFADSSSKTIHVVHPSVREFLLTVLEKPPEIPSNITAPVEHYSSPADQHLYLSSVCLAFLNYDNVWNGEHPFLDYASRFWHEHLQHAEAGETQLSETLNNFLRIENTAFTEWAEYFEFYLDPDHSDLRIVGTPLYYAALFNLATTMKSILREDKTQVNVSGGKYGSPLAAACMSHNHDSFQLLLESGADVNLEGGVSGTALIAAATDGLQDMVRILISHNADLEAMDVEGRTALYAAAVNGHEEVLKDLLASGAKTAVINKAGYTPVAAGAFHGYIKVVEMLLDHSGGIDDQNRYGWTPINVAAGNGHLGVVLLLLARGADVNLASNKHETPLTSAAAHGHVEVARLLLKHGARIDARLASGSTAIVLAAGYGHHEVVQLLIEHGADVNDHDREQTGWTPLNAAASAGHVESVRLLCEHGADVHRRYSKGMTSILVAARGGHVEVVRQLREYGANINDTADRGIGICLLAAFQGNLGVMRLLLDLDKEIGEQSSYGWTPIHEAVSGGHLEMTRLLLERGANAAKQTVIGQTPINIAAGKGHLEIAQLLLDHGVDINQENGAGWAPINKAASSGNKDLVELLLDRGADINKPGGAGWTPLNTAARNGYLDIVRLLLDRGADATITNLYGETPLQSATFAGSEEIVDCLIGSLGPLSREVTANINVVDGLHGTVVSRAAYDGNFSLLQKLTEKYGADITIRDTMGRTALHHAARGGNFRCVNYLIDRGLACSDRDDYGNSTCFYAFLGGSVEVCQRVLEFDPLPLPKANQWSLRHWVYRGGDRQLLELLSGKIPWKSWVSTSRPLAAWEPRSMAIYHHNLHFDWEAQGMLMDVVSFESESVTPMEIDYMPTELSTQSEPPDTSLPVAKERGIRFEGVMCDYCNFVSVLWGKLISADLATGFIWPSLQVHGLS